MTPSEWRRSVIVPIHKKRRDGATKVVEFRGISLVSVVQQAMCSIVQWRLVHVTEERQLIEEACPAM